MQLGDYEVRVNQGEEVDKGYVLLEHNTKYSITLKNYNINDCDAKVHIDGICVGTFRISANSSSTIERPTSETGYFTFLKFESDEAIQAKLNKNKDLGLVSVIFKSEKSSFLTPSQQQGGFQQQGVSAGGTGLSGESSQKFSKVKQLDYDEEKTIKINLRLICKEKDMIRPLVARETDTPQSLFDSFEDASMHAKNKKSGSVIRNGDGKGFLWRP